MPCSICSPANSDEAGFDTHKGSQDRFYADLIHYLFKNQLHLANQNSIVFARRGNKAKQHSLRAAVQKATDKFRQKYKNAHATQVDIDTSRPVQEAVLQAVDYMLWAVQRAFERREMRYFEYMRSKIEIVWDIYDFEKFKAKGKVVYDRRKNPFAIEKTSPLS